MARRGIKPEINALSTLMFLVVLILLFLVNKIGGLNIAAVILMLLGTQWYILFNVIAGTMAIPKEMKLAAENFKLTGMLKWKKLILPAVLPYYVTGVIAAAGGCWNASIVAEYVEWGEHKIIIKGIGSYITCNAEIGDMRRVVLGMLVMGIIIILIDRTVWHNLYKYIERFKI